VLIAVGHFPAVSGYKLSVSSSSLIIKLNIMSRTVKQAYRKSRRFDKTCRNNGSCAYCRGNRLYKHNKKLNAYKTNTNKE
jgi:hypothetical protein